MPKTVRFTLASAACAMGLAAPGHAADCPDRFESTRLEYLGRSTDNQKSYWLTASNRADNYRLSAPGVAEIDRWTSTGASVHLSDSPVVLNDINGTHKLDRMNADGSFDCFLQSRNQTNPLLPPTWRPPARPELPEVVRPEVPDRPVAIKPEVPGRPVVVRPELPGRPVVVRPELPDKPVVVRPTLPDRPVAIKPVLPDRPTVVRPELPDMPVAVKPTIPDRPVAIKPVLPDPPTVVRPELPDMPVAVKPTTPDRPVAVKPVLPDRPTAVRPEIPDRPEVVRPERPTGISPEQPVIVEASGTYFELPAGKILDYCPDASLADKDKAGQAVAMACPELAAALRRAPLTPGRDLVADTPINVWVDTLYMQSRNRRGFAETQDDSGTVSIGADYRVASTVTAGMMVSVRKQDEKSLWGHVSTDATGWLAGPYIGFALSRQWSLFANASAGEIRRDHKILSLSGESKAFQYAAMLNAQGDYPIGNDMLLRPKVGINYMNEAARDYQLNGTLLNRNVTVATASKQRDSGQIQGSLEFSGRFAAGKNLYVPYAELGAIYNYLAEGPNAPDWQGLVRLGARMRIGTATQLDLSSSYQSLGVSNLDIWDIRLFASWAFN